MTNPITTGSPVLAAQNTTTQLSSLAATAGAGTRPSSSADGDNSWYAAMAKAWGQTLDGEANNISTMSNGLSAGNDTPSDITKLTAESMKMSFLSQSSSSSLDSVGKGLETMARKG